jgi:Holliday junction resolvasome RuvABC endonuclease subunit
VKIIGIDLGTKCGISMLEISEDGTVCRTTALNVDRKLYGMQFNAFDDAVYNLLYAHRAENTYVFFEDVKAHSSNAAAHMYGYYRGTVQRECFVLGLQCVGIGVGTVKKHSTGKGNASKDEVAEGAFRILADTGTPVVSFHTNTRPPAAYISLSIDDLTDDQTDSIAIALAGLSMVRGDIERKDSSDPTRKVIF